MGLMGLMGLMGPMGLIGLGVDVALLTLADGVPGMGWVCRDSVGQKIRGCNGIATSV